MEHKDYFKNYIIEMKQVCDRLDIEEIGRFVDILFTTWKNGKKVITVGNGGSAGTASHFAGDLIKTVVNDSSQKEVRTVRSFKALCLTDNVSALTAWVNDSGWDNCYTGLLNSLLEEGDTLLLLSVHGGSGWSGNLVRAMEFAKERGANVIGFAGFDGGKMKEMCNSCVVVPVESTPIVEGLHCDLQHMVIFRLKHLIEEYQAEINH
mgnify:CR=1 FL=1